MQYDYTNKNEYILKYDTKSILTYKYFNLASILTAEFSCQTDLQQKNNIYVQDFIRETLQNLNHSNGLVDI